ncbi:MAG: hypothetical protein E7549_05475 [Ruminococcaceae bacterium]|nr:hypothetical protein [Oscillospiraceae bacterium]
MAQTREEQILEIDARAKKDKQRWLFIMFGIMAAIVAVAAALIAVIGLQAAVAGLIGGIIGLAITAKLCMAQIGKINERHRNDLNKLDNKGHY